MSLTVEKSNTNNASFSIYFVGRVRVYKIYKKNTDGTYIDVYSSTFDAEDSVVRVNMRGFDSLIVIYDQVSVGALVNIVEFASEYSSFYSCSFKMTEIKHKSIAIEPIITNMRSTNISATVAVSINDKVETFEYPINGDFVASSSYDNKYPVSHFTYTEKDKISNQSFSIYTPNNVLETDLFTFNRNTITNKTGTPFSLFLELRIFSIAGKIEESPVIKDIRVLKYDNNL